MAVGKEVSGVVRKGGKMNVNKSLCLRNAVLYGEGLECMGQGNEFGEKTLS